MVAFSVTAIRMEAVVSCNSLPSTQPHRIKTQASTTANTPKRSAVSNTKAIKRSPSLAKRYLPALRTGVERGAAGVTACAGSITPDSSKRYCPDGIASPQQLQFFEYRLIWLWQYGHSIFCLVRGNRQSVKDSPVTAGYWHHGRTTSGGHCPFDLAKLRSATH